MWIIWIDTGDADIDVTAQRVPGGPLGSERSPVSGLCGVDGGWQILARPETLRRARWGGSGDESVPRRQLPVLIRDLEDQCLTKTPYSGM